MCRGGSSQGGNDDCGPGGHDDHDDLGELDGYDYYGPGGHDDHDDQIPDNYISVLRQ